MHQIAPNCTILKKIFGEACPETPLGKLQISKSEKFISWPPPHVKSWDAPGVCVCVCVSVMYPFLNYCTNMDFESVNKRFICIYVDEHFSTYIT